MGPWIAEPSGPRRQVNPSTAPRPARSIGSSMLFRKRHCFVARAGRGLGVHAGAGSARSGPPNGMRGLVEESDVGIRCLGTSGPLPFERNGRAERRRCRQGDGHTVGLDPVGRQTWQAPERTRDGVHHAQSVLSSRPVPPPPRHHERASQVQPSAAHRRDRPDARRVGRDPDPGADRQDRRTPILPVQLLLGRSHPLVPGHPGARGCHRRVRWSSSRWWTIPGK